MKKNLLILFAMTFVLKLGMAFYFSGLSSCNLGPTHQKAGVLAIDYDDTPSYLGAIDNLITEGTFYYFNGKRNVYAGRTPFYGAVYYPFRIVLPPAEARDSLAVLQILIEALANVFFALLCFDILKQRLALFIGYIFYFLSFQYFVETYWLAPESITLSFLVFFLYFFNRYWQRNERRMIFISSIFLALIVSMKAYMVLIYIPLGLIYLYREELLDIKKTKSLLLRGGMLVLPLILLLAPWIVRNAIVLDRFIPFQEDLYAGFDYSTSELAFRRFLNAWNGSFDYANLNNSACLFSTLYLDKCQVRQIPESAVANGYDLNDVENVRQRYLDFQRNPTVELNDEVTKEFDRLTVIYRTQKPFNYYIVSGFWCMKYFLFHSNSFDIPVNSGSSCFQHYQIVFKLIQASIYLMAMSLGTIGLILLTLNRKISILFIAIPITIIVFFCFIFQISSPRYFAHAYCFFVLGLAGIVCNLLNRIKLLHR